MRLRVITWAPESTPDDRRACNDWLRARGAFALATGHWRWVIRWPA